MGIGDEIMAAGEARRLQRRDPRPVAVVDRQGRPRWHPIWRGNPRIARPERAAAGLDVQRLVNAVGARPHIAAATAERYVFRHDWRPSRAEIFLSAAERAFGRRGAGGVVVEPNLKPRASPNKRWPWARWQALVAARPDLDWIQLGPAGTPTLAAVRPVETADFRAACAVLARARAAVLPEGALHHAAAALGVPAVVVHGAFVAPSVTGYRGQTGIYRPHTMHGRSCGLRLHCPACAAAMAGITVDEVLQCLEERL